MDEALDTDTCNQHCHIKLTILEETWKRLSTLSHQTNNTGGDMEEALNTDIHVINVVTSN